MAETVLHLIEFRFPEQVGTVWAWQQDGEPFGLTFNREDAARFADAEAAERTLGNAYGKETASYGYVVAR